MAVTKIIPIHIGRSNNALRSIAASTEYIMNPDKTNNGDLISSFACEPETIAAEFLLSRREYFHKYGRKNNNDIVAYHFIQSFIPGEINPEEANKIGYETASRLLKGNHAFIVTTHTDKSHIHNHIIWNSTSIDGKRKFRNFFNSYFYISRLSDLICIENKLSVIANPTKHFQNSFSWKEYPKKNTNREILRFDIDNILKNKPKTFDDFLSELSANGYEIKQSKTISLRKNGQKKFIRLSSLGDGYSEEIIKLIIKGSRKKTSRVISKRPDLLIDIEQKLSEGKGVGYKKFAEVFNIKQLSKSVLYVQEKGFKTIDEFSEYVKLSKSKIDKLQSEINDKNQRMDEIKELENQIIIYAKYSKIFAEYKKRKYSKVYFEEHKNEIRDYKSAKKFFDSQNFESKKLPKISDLRAEFDECKRAKNICYDEIIPLRKEHHEMLIHLKNIESILKTPDEKSYPENTKRETAQEH